MAVKYTDSEIGGLLRERKVLPANWRARVALKLKRGHQERQLELTGDSGSKFRLILRQSDINPLDFSVILAVSSPRSNQVFLVRRYNGRSHTHKNKIEGNQFYDFHIHTATERYQRSGPYEDAYAERTDRYSDFNGALRCLIEDAHLEEQRGPRPSPYEDN